jgi:hypothetical protein
MARDRALADLDRAYALIAWTQEAARREQGVSGFGALVNTIFLLDTHPSSAVAKTVRVLYYVSLAWVALWVAAALMFGVAGAALEIPETSSSLALRLAIAFGISVLCLAVGLSPALVLYLIDRSTTTRGLQLPPYRGH